jgi:GNAT superfamily N-acetyltransferase
MIASARCLLLLGAADFRHPHHPRSGGISFGTNAELNEVPRWFQAYRRHGLAAALLDRVLADASARGAGQVEAYPFTDAHEGDGGNFRGPRSMYDQRHVEPVRTRARDTVVRRRL